MPWWGTVSLALGSSAITAVATIGASWLTRVGGRRDRRELSAESQRQRGGEVLAFVGLLLSDTDPVRMGLNASPELQEALASTAREWDERREALLMYANSQPSDDIRYAVQRLIVVVGNALKSTTWFVRDLLRHESSEVRREVATIDHEAAVRVLDAVVTAVRDEKQVQGLKGRIENLEAAAQTKTDAVTRSLFKDQ